jgi:hypothetical protein
VTATNIYEEILANIDADKRAWCQGTYTARDDEGKPISRCLVEHVNLAVGTSYVKPNGKVFVSKDVRRYKRRERILAHLAALLPKKLLLEEADPWGFGEDNPEVQQKLAEITTPYEVPVDRIKNMSPFVQGTPYFPPSEDVVIGFNDAENTTKAKVRNLLKRAAKSHPED